MEHTLSFGKITLLTDDIAEVVVGDGVEMSVAQVEEYHDFLLKYLKAPFSLLVNKKNHYSYSFDAQLLLGTLVEINVMAILIYTPVMSIAQTYLNNLPRDSQWHTRQFNERSEALEWLIAQQQLINE